MFRRLLDHLSYWSSSEEPLIFSFNSKAGNDVAVPTLLFRKKENGCAHPRSRINVNKLFREKRKRKKKKKSLKGLSPCSYNSIQDMKHVSWFFCVKIKSFAIQSLVYHLYAEFSWKSISGVTPNVP